MSDIENLIQQFQNTAQRLEIAYIQLEQQLIDGCLDATTDVIETVDNPMHIWEFRQNLLGLIESTDQAILVCSADGEIPLMNENARAIFKKEAELLHGNQIFQPGFEAEIAGFLTNGKETQRITLNMLPPIGRLVEFDARVHRDNFSKEKLVSLLCKDDQINETLIFKDKRRLQGMAKNVAHNMRTPMSAIQGFSSLLERELKLEGHSSEKLDYIVDGVKRLDGVIRSLIQYSQPDEAPAVSSLQLKEELLTLVDKWESTHTKPDFVELKCELDTKTQKMPLNHSALENIIDALLNNAAEANADRVQLRVVESQNNLQMEFSDNGDGMNSEVQANCREAFFTTKMNKIGLGLNICENIVGILAGQMKIETREGKGTTLHLHFPKSEQVVE